MDRYFNRRSALALIAGLIVVPSRVSARALAKNGATPESGAVGAVSLESVAAGGIAQGLPGVNLLVSFDDGEIHTATAGVSSIELDTPLSLDDRFRIYSITKTFTAIITLQLVEERLITLDDVVPQWLDDAEVLAIQDIQNISIRQLLTHTSGIYDYFDDESPFLTDAFFGPTADWSRVWTPQELLAYAGGSKVTPYFAPGLGQHYSNSNYILLGLIIEQATGNTFATELNTRILDPLELTSTAFEGDLPAVTSTVDGYHLIDAEVLNVTSANLSWAWTAGGVTSTVGDLARFADAVFTGSLLKPDSFNEMFAFEGTSDDVTEGMGVFSVETPYGQVIGMDGESAGFSSFMFRIPDAEVTIVALANLAPGGMVFETVRDRTIEWAATRA
ncbi:N/A [soil metagenome]